MNTNKIISSAKWILGTIILGALGSGLWELFFSDLLSWLGLFSLEIASDLIAGFRDTLYEQVSNGAVFSLLKLPAMLTAMIFVMMPTVLLIRIVVRHFVYNKKASEDREPSEITEELTRNNLKMSVASILVVVYIFAAFQYLYTANAANFVEKSIDILAPHISEDKRLILQADYRSIKGAESYFAIYSELKHLEKKYSVTLPDFDPI